MDLLLLFGRKNLCLIKKKDVNPSKTEDIMNAMDQKRNYATLLQEIAYVEGFHIKQKSFSLPL